MQTLKWHLLLMNQTRLLTYEVFANFSAQEISVIFVKTSKRQYIIRRFHHSRLILSITGVVIQ